MLKHQVVSRAEWEEASRALLAEEKAFTRERDRVAELRRAMPWVKVEKDYRFESERGPVSLSDLFDGRPQLIVSSFMFGPNWEEGCFGCSFGSDSIDSARQHFEHNGVTLVTVSRAPLEKLLAYRERMGWTFDWFSSADSDFNFDHDVSFTTEQRAAGRCRWNVDKTGDPGSNELSAINVFYRDDDGTIYRTYSSAGRGGEDQLISYRYLDLTALGRNEPSGDMSDWVRRHDQYPDDGRTMPKRLSEITA